MSSSRVFLIAQPSVRKDGQLPDLTPLAEHGDLIVLVELGIYPSNHPQAAKDLITKRLSDFNHNIDSITWAGGDTLAALLAGIALSNLNVPFFDYLRFDRDKDSTGVRLRTGQYNRVRVILNVEQEVYAC